MLGGRRLQGFPQRTARLLLGVCAAILIFGQVQLFASQLGQQYAQALVQRAEYGTRVVEIDRAAATFDQLRAFLREVQGVAVPVWTWYSPPTPGDPVGSDELAMSCRSLQTLGGRCGRRPTLPAESANKSVAALRAATPLGAQVRLFGTPHLAQFRRVGAQLLLVSPDGKNLPKAELQATSARFIAGGLGLSTQWQGWVGAGRLVKLSSGWTVVFGAFGVAVVAAVTALVMAGDVVASTGEAARLAALVDRWRWIAVLAFWRLAVPLTLAGVASALAYLVLPTGISSPGEVFMTPSTQLAFTSIVLAVAVGVLLSVWSTRAIVRAGRRWHPGHGE